jgi:hypothetical protein
MEKVNLDEFQIAISKQQIINLMNSKHYATVASLTSEILATFNKSLTEYVNSIYDEQIYRRIKYSS